MTELAVRTEGLTKTFGTHTAVDDLDLVVPRGSVFGFLGPNGSGKTTTIRLLLGLASATAGTAHVLGHHMPQDLGEVLPRVGALVEGPAHYPYLSGAANLRRLDAANPAAPPRTRQTRVAAALEKVGLSHAGTKRVRAYSLGMKQRLGIAGALLMPRELLVLDEPTNGLDPQGTREVRTLVRSLTGEGVTVLVSSHLLAEVEQTCSHVGVMSRGRLVAQGSLTELQDLGQARVRVVTPDPQRARAMLARIGLRTSDDDQPGTGNATDPATDLATPPASSTPERVAVVTAVLAEERYLPETIAAELVAGGVRLRGFGVVRETLEERFVALTGEGFDVAG
ncbi:ABC transporter ATP-binding protein [Pseudactinotalea sp. Z1748]|uniref:ABC transporter ATP-binding protein n=1 Tax=Pseudactinotalea sp. Z1748 TaxID=3413027 RepID=UPI003C7ABAB7